MLLNEYEQHQIRLISHYSRRSKSLAELQGRLKERGIKMKFTEGRNKRIVFATQRNFRIDSKLGKDRVFTDIARKNVDRNAKLHTVKNVKNEPKNQYSKFDELREKSSKKRIESKKQCLGKTI